MSPHVQIPIELLELIIENVDGLSSESRECLVACSYTNRAFVDMCQKRIFRDIQIRKKLDRVMRWTFTEARGSDGDRFLGLITTQKSQHLAPYVLTLSINVEHALSYGYYNSKPDKKAHSSSNPDFPLYAIIPLLQNLKKFAVISPLLGPLFVEWDTLEGRVKKFFTETAQRLPEIDFRFFSDMLVSTFSNCPALEVLYISCVHTWMAPWTRSKLKFLDFGYGSPPNLPPNDIREHFDPTYSPFDITHLTGLKLSSTNFLASDVDHILALCANTLESLDLQVGIYGDCRLSYSSRSVVSRPEATPPNLSSLQNLRSLTLRTSISGYARPGEEDFYHSTMPFIPAILETLPRNMHPPTFELVLDMFCLKFSMNHLATFPWSEVVNTLDQVRILRNLATVKFLFHKWTSWSNDGITNSGQLAKILDRNDDWKKLDQKNIFLVFTSHCEY